MNSEMSSTENYLADKDNKDSYSEASENVSEEESELSPAEKDVNGKINPKEFPVVALFAIVFGLIFIFGLIFFFIIRKFKEHKHTFTK
jgi:ATP-dependent Zn protease